MAVPWKRIVHVLTVELFRRSWVFYRRVSRLASWLAKRDRQGRVAGSRGLFPDKQRRKAGWWHLLPLSTQSNPTTSRITYTRAVQQEPLAFSSYQSSVPSQPLPAAHLAHISYDCCSGQLAQKTSRVRKPLTGRLSAGTWRQSLFLPPQLYCLPLHPSSCRRQLAIKNIPDPPKRRKKGNRSTRRTLG